MQDILKSTLLEFEKSFFYIDFIKSPSEEKQVTILQTMRGNYKKQGIRIDHIDLPEIIEILQQYNIGTFEPDAANLKNYFSKEQQQSIVTIYLKGVSINDVALQFNCSAEIIKQVLVNRKIEIVDQDLTNYREAFRRMRRNH